MTVTEGIRTLLTAESTITALTGQRIYVDDAGQDTAFPYVVIREASFNARETLEGVSGLAEAQVEITCHADRSVVASDVRDAIYSYLDNYTGAAGTRTIAAMHPLTRRNTRIPPRDSSQNSVHIYSQPFTVFFS